MTREGVDYSTTPPGAAALKAAGKDFVVRYLSRDSRGITKAEYVDLYSNGIDVAVVFESTADRAAAGRTAGIFDATLSINIMAEVGLPASMPIYFVGDDTDDQTVPHGAIIDYLTGCADVVGWPRVGVYGSYDVMNVCLSNSDCYWFWQTYAWSGGRFSEQSNLYQYHNGVNIGGTDCDLDRAFGENFGQASMFDGPVYADPIVPITWAEHIAAQWPTDLSFQGDSWRQCRRNAVALSNTQRYSDFATTSPHSGPKVAKGNSVHVECRVDIKGVGWIVTPEGHHLKAAAFSPVMDIHPRKRNVKL